MFKNTLTSKKIVIISLAFILAISLFFNMYKKSDSPPGFDADEAAFGYNAYSISKTGRDEYGKFLPLRFKSFGDYKMPLYSYLSVPNVAIFGLTEESTRLLNTIIALLLPLVIYFLTKDLFKDSRIALLSSLLIATSLGLNSIGRQAHEAYLAAFFVSLSCLFFVKYIKQRNLKIYLLFLISLVAALFSYQSSRVFVPFFFLVLLYFVLKEKLKKSIIIFFILAACIFLVTDILYKPERVKNLFFVNNIGFSLKINELRGEGGSRFVYNKLTLGVRDTLYQQLKYYSPNFLVINGDENNRFGFVGMSPITVLEYLLAFVGIYYLFKRKQKWRYFIVLLLLVTPFSASLSYGESSLTRSFFMLIPILILSSYGLVNFLDEIKSERAKKATFLFLVVTEVFLLFYSWDFYFNHYYKRGIVLRDWQVGYRELENYLSKNYNKFNNFYVTPKNGEPYIFTLFYLRYSPESYQKQANLSAPDQYGFGQIEKFDKFTYQFKDPSEVGEKSSIIGYPDDFQGLNIDKSKIEKITVGGQEIFWIYEK